MATSAAKDEGPTKETTRNWKDYVTRTRVIAGVIIILALFLIFQNTTTGDFHFLFFDIKAPRWVWFLGLFAGGFACGWLWTRHRQAVKSVGRDIMSGSAGGGKDVSN